MTSTLKYFGIGLSRTGTTSLYSAFKMLGFKCVHYPQPKQFQALDRYDFANDTPIPARFKKLDKRFSNSKFIYTTRDIDSWIVSCAEYFSSEKAQIIKPKYDFQMKYRIETYGVVDFDEEIFRMVYEEHDKSIKEYFKNRPDDLLTINISQGEGWEKLIPFIIKSSPDFKASLPHKNKIVKFEKRKRNMVKNKLNKFRRDGESKTIFPIIPVPQDTNEIRLFSVVKNEKLRIHSFLDYYRKLGVDRFFIVDNNSDDGTFEYLCDQSDVQVFRTDESFYFEKDWIMSLLNSYGKSHWCILADADERFIYPDYENITLRDFCKGLEKGGYNAVDGLLLDLYSDKPITKSHFIPDENPLLTFNLFDKDSHEVCNIKKFSNKNSGAKIFRGGVHKRAFDRNYQLSKVPLIKYDGQMNFITSGHHYINKAKLAPTKVAVLHFKFFSELLKKAESLKLDDKEYYSMHYKKYYRVLNDLPDLTLKYEGSEVFTGSKQLIELGIMR